MILWLILTNWGNANPLPLFLWKFRSNFLLPFISRDIVLRYSAHNLLLHIQLSQKDLYLRLPSNMKMKSTPCMYYGNNMTFNNTFCFFCWSLPFPFKSMLYWSHLIFVIDKFSIILINEIFVIIALTRLTQAGKISFINTILFRSHIHYLMNLEGTYKLQKMREMIDAIQYCLWQLKK